MTYLIHFLKLNYNLTATFNFLALNYPYTHIPIHPLYPLYPYTRNTRTPVIPVIPIHPHTRNTRTPVHPLYPYTRYTRYTHKPGNPQTRKLLFRAATICIFMSNHLIFKMMSEKSAPKDNMMLRILKKLDRLEYFVKTIASGVSTIVLLRAFLTRRVLELTVTDSSLFSTRNLLYCSI